MKFPIWLKVYGNTDYRGACPKENAEQVTAISEIRRRWPDTWGKMVVHPENEGKRSYGQAAWAKAGGMTKGASDVIIPIGFVCEIKRRDHTASSWQKGQIEYLKAVHDAGGYACVALGWEAAIKAVKEWENSC